MAISESTRAHERNPAGATRAADDRAIPGVAREQLNTVPLDRWKRDKDRFVYESWIAKAKVLVAQ